MANRVSMEDIAIKLGITRNTVSLALRGMPGINPETRKLIQKAAQEMGYDYGNNHNKNRHANSKSICLIMPKGLRNSGSFYSGIQYGIETEARANSINTLLHYYEEAPVLETPLCVRDGIVSGILALGHMPCEKLKTISDYGIPTVVIDEYHEGLELDYVLSDNLNGAYTAVEYLIRKGHRKICFLGDLKKASSFQERYLGMIKAMNYNGLDFDPGLNHIDLNVSDPDGMSEVMHMLHQATTAFFCCNDPHALELYKVLSTAGIRIPDDISIVGFDDIESAVNITPPLTTVRVETEYMGKRAVRMLLEKLAVPGRIPEKVLIPTQLVERSSVRTI